MSRVSVFLAVASLLVIACGGPATPPEPVDYGTFRLGETVTFSINDTVHVCTGQMPYRIVQITEGTKRPVLLEHSCLGIAGTGVDQFCENGDIQYVPVGTCSDAIFCEDQDLDETIRWDQQEYVEITEDCAGQTIRREVLQQAPPGNYQVVVQDWKEDHIEHRVLGEFTITSD
jgi:hypothetical protein